MTVIRVKPVEIIGHCRAKLTPDDEFQIAGSNLENPGGSHLCIFALSHFAPIVSVLQRGKRIFAHASCSNCMRLGRENCVVFLLGHADKWELCQMLSDYRRICRQIEEPAEARQLRAEAMQHQDREEYPEALRKMGAALAELQQAARYRETLQGVNSRLSGKAVD